MIKSEFAGIPNLAADILARPCTHPVPLEVRRRRGLERDKDVVENETMWQTWMPLEKDFLDRQNTRDWVDLVVDGTRPWA